MKYFIANWKMNMTSDTLQNWFGVFNANYKEVAGKSVLIAPSELYLLETKKLINYPSVQLCAQDVDMFEKGAHTGATGAFQLREFCHYSIIGHSERKESRDVVYQKRELCLKNNIIPIVCFVEPDHAADAQSHPSLIAWEDPQNISLNGSYRAKDPQEIKKNAELIRKHINADTVLIYGGSVNRENIGELAQISEINGYLVGNASLDPGHFLDIIDRA